MFLRCLKSPVSASKRHIPNNDSDSLAFIFLSEIIFSKMSLGDFKFVSKTGNFLVISHQFSKRIFRDNSELKTSFKVNGLS